MYCCQDCKREFEYVEVVFERHSLSSPPYERIKLCPFCHSNNFSEIKENHCRFCGSRLRHEGEYCSSSCRKRGGELKKDEDRRREFLKDSLIMKAVAEVEEFNRLNNTNYSYGQYFAMKQGKIKAGKGK